MKDYYQILGIQQNASESEVKSAYRKFAKIYHPDINQGNANMEAKFKEINEAYETLKDSHKRAVYDNDLAVHRDVSARRPRDNYWANRPNYHDINLDEVLKDIQKGRWSADTKNRDITLSYSITLEEAFTGKDANIRYTIQGVNKEVSVKIPSGIQDGIKLRFKGYGDTALAGVAAGDLFIRIQIIPNPNFTRVDDNLVTKVTVGYLEALVGSECEIPTIEGTKLKMRIPAGIHPGQTLRAAKKGMMRSDGTRGDMMIEISFVPEKLTEDERRAISDILAKRNG